MDFTLPTNQYDLSIFLNDLKNKKEFERWTRSLFDDIAVTFHKNLNDEINALCLELLQSYYSWYSGYSFGMWEYAYNHYSTLEDSKFYSVEKVKKIVEECKTLHKDWIFVNNPYV